MRSKLLFIEDNPHKRDRVLDFLDEKYETLQVSLAHSFTTGCRSLESDRFDIVLADISLPTYDKTSSESGGRFRPFAGLELARKIARRDLAGFVAFITQYRSFSERTTSYTFDQLHIELKNICGTRYGGIVLYDGSQSVWKDQLSVVIDGFVR